MVRVDKTAMRSTLDTETDYYSNILTLIDKLLDIGIKEDRIGINPNDGGSLFLFEEWLEKPDEEYQDYHKPRKKYERFIDDVDFLAIEKSKGGE